MRKPAPWAPTSVSEMWAEAKAPIQSHPTGPEPLTQYANDPVGFAVDVLGVKLETVRWSDVPEYRGHQWDGTRDPLAVALEHLAAHRWIGVASGTGTGKTFLMAVAFLWWIAVRREAIAVTVATKEDQMAKGVWKEIGRLLPPFKVRFPTAEMTHLRLRMDPALGDAWGGWGITAKPSADAKSNTSVQGLHAAWLLILVDEMPGVDQSIITALENTATDPGNVIAGFGNPDHDTDPLAKFSRQSGVQPIRISGLDHPNVVTGRTLVPGAVSRQSVLKRLDDMGEQSPMFKSRVRGIAPEQASDALVHRVWVEAAVAKGRTWAAITTDHPLSKHPRAVGLDPSNSDGGDEAADAWFLGPWCYRVRSTGCPDANVFGAAMWLEAQGLGVDPQHIGVDPIGVGAGTVNEMRRLGAAVVPLNGGGAPKARIAKGADASDITWDANQFLNLRAQMYWQAREDLRKGLVGLPDDPELVDELVMPTYEVRSGKVVVEPKDDIKRRLGRSPNKADAFVYGNWVRPRTVPVQGLPPGSADSRHLGFTKANGKVRPLTIKDVAVRPQMERPAEKLWSSWRSR